MPKSDDELEQLREQHQPGPKIPLNELVLRIGIAYIPGIGPALAAFYNYLTNEEFQSRFETFKEHVIDSLKRYGKELHDFEARLDSQESVKLQGLIAERILWGATEAKVKRFAAVMAYTFVSAKDSKDVDDVTAFVRALDELSERDIEALHYLYDNQHELFSQGRDLESESFFASYRMKNLIDGIGRIGLSKEQFYARCARLNGYGLALSLEKPRGTDPTIMAFRITELGLRLVELLKVEQQ
jgi:hypothetical protein